MAVTECDLSYVHGVLIVGLPKYYVSVDQFIDGVYIYTCIMYIYISNN